MPSGELATARVNPAARRRLMEGQGRDSAAHVSLRDAKLRPKGPTGSGIHGRRLHVSRLTWRADADGMAVPFLGTIPKGFEALGHRSWSTTEARGLCAG